MVIRRISYFKIILLELRYPLLVQKMNQL